MIASVTTYDPKGNVVGQTDGAGRTTTLTYAPPTATDADPVKPNDAKPTKATDAYGNDTTFAYDTHGNLTQSTDAG